MPLINRPRTTAHGPGTMERWFGERQYFMGDVRSQETPLVVHFHGTTERAMDYIESSEYHVQRALQSLCSEDVDVAPEALQAYIASLRGFLDRRACGGSEFGKLPASVIFVGGRF